MQIAILSGKGGTGKTTVSTNLAKVMNCRYIDSDVEEPNGYLFLKPKIKESMDVFIPVPHIDEEKCINCKKCVSVCQFNALVHTSQGIIIFETLCHGCGACSQVCPTEAIAEKNRPIGHIIKGDYPNNEFLGGTLNIGEPMAGPIIRKLRDAAADNKTTLIDCSPGSSCNVVKAILGVDYAVLVTEPTPFGLHDLKIAIDLVKKLKIPFGVIINRITSDNNLVSRYCLNQNIPILGTIPFDKDIAVMYSEGKLLVDDKNYQPTFEHIAANIKEAVYATCSH